MLCSTEAAFRIYPYTLASVTSYCIVETAIRVLSYVLTPLPLSRRIALLRLQFQSFVYPYTRVLSRRNNVKLGLQFQSSWDIVLY